MTANTGCPFGVIAESNPITVSVIAPVVLGSINGPTDACPLIGNSATYRVDAVNGVSVYNWTAPAGTTIINGQGTNEITLSYNAGFGTSGNLLVTGGTCSNPVPSILTIVKNTPEAPGDISGPATVCGSVGNNTQITYSVAPVAYASSYLWSLPSTQLSLAVRVLLPSLLHFKMDSRRARFLLKLFQTVSPVRLHL